MRAHTSSLLLASSAVSATTAFVPISTMHPYQLSYGYIGRAFFDNFQFYTGSDPTNGHVKYVDRDTASSTSLAGFLPELSTANSSTGPIYLGVDAKTPNTTAGRSSVRVNSIQKFNHSLILADILHMPAPVCGTWPALWMLGSGATWPDAGEIDILENINDAKVNKYTLHTNAGITTTNYTAFGGQKGNLTTANCDVNAVGQDRNTGCSITDASDAKSYGDAFNDNNGGVFATLIDSYGIRIWFFPRDAIPSDITVGSPNPPSRNMKDLPGANSTWPKPNARFDAPNNTVDTHFRDMQIIINTEFCGDWAGSVWNTSETCSKLAPTCEEYVTNNPEAFEDVYWAINSIKVFERVNDTTTPYPDGHSKRLPPSPPPYKRHAAVVTAGEKRAQVAKHGVKRNL